MAAGMTGTSSTSGAVEMTMPPECWERWRGRPRISSIRNAEGPPARRVQPPAQLVDLVGRHLAPGVGQPGHALDLALGQRQRLAQVADRAARAVGGEGGHQGGVLGPVALDHVQHQPLAHVAREVEVDVGHAGQVAGQEAAQEEPGRHRIDVREPDQVADDRADARAAPAAGRQQAAAGARPRTRAATSRAISRISRCSRKKPASRWWAIRPSSSSSRSRASRTSVECRRSGAPARRGRAAPAPPGPARRCPRSRGSGSPGRWVRSKRQRSPTSTAPRTAAAGEAGSASSSGAPQHRLVVAAALGLAGLERRVQADGHQRVLQERPARAVGVRIAGGHGAHPQPLGQLGQQPVAAGVAAPVGALQLDREPLAAEHPPQPPGQSRSASRSRPSADQPGDRAMAGAARQAVQALGVPGHLLERRPPAPAGRRRAPA